MGVQCDIWNYHIISQILNIILYTHIIWDPQTQYGGCLEAWDNLQIFDTLDNNVNEVISEDEE